MSLHHLTSVEREQLLVIAYRAARDAGAAILDIYSTGFDVRRKADASPVTEADERAEAIILRALVAAAPDIPVIAEEQAAAKGLPATAPVRFWLVDPLDGTKEFINHNGEFTVNIALVEEECPVLGVVDAPALGVTYGSAGPGTAWRQYGAGPRQPIAARHPPTEPIVVHSRSHADKERLAHYVAALPNAKTQVAGSSIKFCLLAAGEADYYPRFGTTMEWDTAAGQAVLDSVGGSVTGLDGTPLRYGKPGFRNSDFIARGLSG